MPSRSGSEIARINKGSGAEKLGEWLAKKDRERLRAKIKKLNFPYIKKMAGE